MGYGVIFECKKCKKKHEIFLGWGFLYPSLCAELTEASLNGKFGDEWKTSCENTENPCVDADKYLYVCKCGYWKEDYYLSLYSVNEGESFILHGESKFVKSFNHICPVCGKRMKKELPEKLSRPLLCHKCGKPLEQSDDYIMWD